MGFSSVIAPDSLLHTKLGEEIRERRDGETPFQGVYFANGKHLQCLDTSEEHLRQMGEKHYYGNYLFLI